MQTFVIFSCFESNEKFVQAEKDAFDYFVNTRANKPAELVGTVTSNYIY